MAPGVGARSAGHRATAQRLQAGQPAGRRQRPGHTGRRARLGHDHPRRSADGPRLSLELLERGGGRPALALRVAHADRPRRVPDAGRGGRALCAQDGSATRRRHLVPRLRRLQACRHRPADLHPVSEGTDTGPALRRLRRTGARSGEKGCRVDERRGGRGGRIRTVGRSPSPPQARWRQWRSSPASGSARACGTPCR